jgi:hypothetical protein
LVCAKSGGDGFFGGGTIGPSGGGGDIALAFEAFAEFVVGAADVFLERVTAALFVASEIIAIVCGVPCCVAMRFGLGWLGTGGDLGTCAASVGGIVG